MPATFNHQNDGNNRSEADLRVSRPHSETSDRRDAFILTILAVLLALLVLSCSAERGDSTNELGSLPPGAYPSDSELSSDPAGSPVSFDDQGVRATRVAFFGETTTALISDLERRALYIGTRSGLIVRLPIGRVAGSLAPKADEAAVALDLRDSISIDGERGLLDMTLLRTGDRVAVTYTAPDGSVVLHIFHLSDFGFVDDIPSPLVLRVPHSFAGHNGGGLALGDDGDLFVSLGDMDSRNYELPFAQDPMSPLGSVLRIPSEYLESDGVRPIDPLSTLLAKGLRNPWRIAFDSLHQQLLIGDVGENRWEEVNVLRLGDRNSISNFGWPNFEGNEGFQNSRSAVTSATIPPALEYAHSADRCAIVLGTVYRNESTATPGKENSLLVGDFCSGDVLAAEINHDSIAPLRRVTVVDGNVVSFGQDAKGEIYVLTVDGGVYRLDPKRWTAPDVAKSPMHVTPATTSTTVERPSESECRVADEILAVRDYTALTPAEMQNHLSSLIKTLEVSVATSAATRVEHLSTLLRIFREVDRVAQSSGYRGSDPVVQSLVAEVLAGTGWSAGFPEAINSVMATREYCS